MGDYATEGSTVYLPLTIKTIGEYEGKKYILCKGTTFHRDLKSITGWRTFTYSIKVKAEGYLTEYVDYELNEGDKIFVVGHLEDTATRKDGMVLRHVLINAESIYRADYLKYYPMRELGEK